MSSTNTCVALIKSAALTYGSTIHSGSKFVSQTTIKTTTILIETTAESVGYFLIPSTYP